MGVYQRKNRKGWVCDWREPNGKKKQSTFKTRKDAEYFESKKKMETSKGIYVDTNKGKQKMNIFFESWIDSKNARPKTIATYTYAWNSLIGPYFGEYQVKNVTKNEIRKWLSNCQTIQQKSPSSATLQKAFTVLSMVLDFAVDDDALSINPAKQLRTYSNESVLPKKLNSKRATPIEPSVVEKIALTCGGYSLAIRVLAYCGPRIGELAGLKVKDINIQNQSLMIERSLSSLGGKMLEGPTKNGKSREVHVMSFIWQDLLKHIEGLDPEEYVFVSPLGQPLNTDNFAKRVWKRALKELNLPPFRIHDLRHTCASIFIQNGASVTLVSKLLGHSDVAFTLRTYSHLFPNDMAEMTEKVSEKLFQQQMKAKTQAINIA